jgi:plastocyanin/uncharacterized membrane protein
MDYSSNHGTYAAARSWQGTSRFGLLLALLACFHSGCGNTRPPSATDAENSPPDLVTTEEGAGATSTPQAADEQYAAVVEMTDELKFIPDRITIEAGQTVLWKNEPSDLPHTVTADPELAKDPKNVQLPEGAEPFNSGELKAGETYTHTFHVPGKYIYFCVPHEIAGMVAEVEVQPAGESQGSAPDLGNGDGEPSSRGSASTGNNRSTGNNGSTGDNGSTEDKGNTSGNKPNNDAEADTQPTYVLGGHQPPRPPDAESATGLLKFVYWLGSFHPAATDLPIALVIAACLSEALRVLTRKEVFVGITRYCLWLGAVSGVAAGLGGWFLAGFRLEDPAWLLDRHRWFGTGTALWIPVAAILMEVSLRRPRPLWTNVFRASLLVALLLVGVSGYLGGAMIYGMDHYFWPN